MGEDAKNASSSKQLNEDNKDYEQIDIVCEMLKNVNDKDTDKNDEQEKQAVTQQHEQKQEQQRPAVKWLKKYINKSMKVKITDGRTLIGIFVCTDKQANVILGQCIEFIEPSQSPESKSTREKTKDLTEEEVVDTKNKEQQDQGLPAEPRNIGLSMIPARHILSIQVSS